MRIACYARVSTTEQAIHGLSIDAQMATLRAFAGDQTVGEYIDAGVSARIPVKKRPELSRLLQDVEADKIDLIVFMRLDRWTRNIREYYKAQDILDAHNVAWKALQEDYETQTAAGRLKVNIMLAVAQDEADRTSERIKAVFDRKRAKGLVPSGAQAFGIVNDKGVLKPSEDAEKVRAAFDAFISARSARAVTIQSKEILGHPLTDNGVRYMLRNESYLTAGVIDKDTWDKTQEILSIRAIRKPKTDRQYLFAGIIVCPVCGCKMTSHCWTYKDSTYIYYRCYRETKNKQCSYNKSVREDSVEEFFLSRLGVMVEDYNIQISEKQKTVNTSSIKSKMDKLTDLYISDVLSKEEYLKRYEPLKNALKEAESTPRAIPKETLVTFQTAYKSLSRTAKKAFWSRLVYKIVPNDDGTFTAYFDHPDSNQLLSCLTVK